MGRDPPHAAVMPALLVAIAAVSVLLGVKLGWGTILVEDAELALTPLEGWAARLAIICAAIGGGASALAMVAWPRLVLLAMWGGVLIVVALVAFAQAVPGAARVPSDARAEEFGPPGIGVDPAPVAMDVTLAPGWYLSLAGGIIMFVFAARASRRDLPTSGASPPSGGR